MILPTRGASYVVDASVALKWFIEEPDAELADRLLDDRIGLHAPAHWSAEVANATWVRTRKQGADGIDTRRGLNIVRALERTSVELHPLEPVLARAFEIATTCDVTVYDALYVATAERLDLPFVTADRRLIRRLAGTPWAQRSLSLPDLPIE